MTKLVYNNPTDLIPFLDLMLHDAESLVTFLKTAFNEVYSGRPHPSGRAYTLEDRLLVLNAYKDAQSLQKRLDEMWSD